MAFSVFKGRSPREAVTERLKDSSPGDSLCAMLRGCSDAEWVWALTEGRAEIERLTGLLPTLPDAMQQRRFTGRNDKEAFAQAAGAVGVFLAEARALGLDVSRPGLRVIDIGCGWGRITQTLFRDFEPGQILGCDVMPEALEICRASGLGVELKQMPYMPPVDLADGSADLMVAYSVFSHLSEEAHMAWVEDFARVLRPGGVLVVTTRPRAFISYAESVRRQPDIPPHARATANAFKDSQSWLDRYDRGEFCFDAAFSDGAGRPEDYYGEAVVPGAYAETHWGRFFESVRFTPADKHRKFDQSVIAARKAL